MAKIKSANGFIHPMHFNKNHLIGKMIHNGVVDVEGTIYHLSPSTFFSDEPIHLFLKRDFYETETEHNERLQKEEELRALQAQQLEERRISQEQQTLQRENERKQKILEFQNAYDIPVKTSIRIKPVLSGLSENSNGDGAKRNTVFHLFIEESLEGRLKRSPDSFLCTPNDLGKWTYLDNDNYKNENSMVTCKKCLQLMERWLKEK